jgi:dTDP-4-amino-4,6-dideoxygalactose transaminase
MSTPPIAGPSFEPVPQLDLAAQYASIGAEIRTAVERVMTSQQFVLGREGAALEEEIANLSGIAHGVGLASGTDALILSLRACGVQPGDEVLLPPFTFVATGSAVSALGAKPVFADIRPDTYNIDPQSNAVEYTRLLNQIPGVMPPITPDRFAHVFHQYTIRVERRDALQQFLSERKIGSTVYYPYPLHLQPLYASLGHKPGDFPHAERAAQEVLSLPMYPELRKEQIARVVDAIAEFLKC